MSEKEPKPLSVRHEAFCQGIARGKSITKAYQDAGYSITDAGAATRGGQLLRNVEVSQRIKELRQQTGRQAEFTRQDLVKFLVSAVTTPVDNIDGQSPLANEATITETGEGESKVVKKRLKGVDKLQASRLLAEMCGWKEPEKIEIKQEVEAGPRTLSALQEAAEKLAGGLSLAPSRTPAEVEDA